MNILCDVVKKVLACTVQSVYVENLAFSVMICTNLSLHTVVKLQYRVLAQRGLFEALSDHTTCTKLPIEKVHICTVQSVNVEKITFPL